MQSTYTKEPNFDVSIQKDKWLRTQFQSLNLDPALYVIDSISGTNV